MLFDVWAVRRDGRYVGHAEIKRTDQVDGHELVYALRLSRAPSRRCGPVTSPAKALPEHEMCVAGFVISLAELGLPLANTY